MPPKCIIYAYCLMPNHVHLLIQEKNQNLSNIIKQIAAAYALYFNKKYERCGHLFQDRFKSESVADAAYFFSSLSELGMDAFGNFACKCGNIFPVFKSYAPAAIDFFLPDGFLSQTDRLLYSGKMAYFP